MRLRQARIEAADRTGVVVDLRDAEVARLEILSDALDPLFSEIPDTIDLFDRGISRGDPPRLWVDVVAHIVMGRDKRTYRFVQDTRHGRIVLAESNEVPPIVEAVTDYVARRIVEREHALAVTVEVGAGGAATASALAHLAVPDRCARRCRGVVRRRDDRLAALALISSRFRAIPAVAAP